MNKSFLILLVFLFMLQACNFKKSIYMGYNDQESNTFKADRPKIDPVNTENKNISINSNQSDEDIESFEFENQENPFIIDVLKHKSEEDFVLENIDGIPINDRYNDSSLYGFQVIYFDFDDKKIKLDQLDKLQNNLKIAQKLKNYNIVIEGHACDSAGSADYNLILSEDRADAILEYFINNGIEKERITKVARGCQMKIVPFGNREQQFPNRRVEIFAYSRK